MVDSDECNCNKISIVGDKKCLSLLNKGSVGAL